MPRTRPPYPEEFKREAIELVHGYVGDGPTTWRRQLDGLSDEFTVIAWDAPGKRQLQPHSGPAVPLESVRS